MQAKLEIKIPKKRTAGEYAENKTLARALILYSYEADIVGLLMSAIEDYSLYSPNIVSMATREVIGIVTQIDQPDARPRRHGNSGRYAEYRINGHCPENIHHVAGRHKRAALIGCKCNKANKQRQDRSPIH